MKKLAKMVCVLLSAILLLTCSVACGGREDSGDESVDSTKSTLYIGFYYAGLGKDWIQQLASDFEEKYKDVSFETGKKGVQVRLDLDKAGLNGGSLLETIAGKRDQIFFIENCDLYQFTSENLVKDITSIVKQKASDSESATIEEKLSKDSKDYYNMNGHYYALPYYESMLGINYNIDLFENNFYYFKKDASADGYTGDIDDLFISSKDDERSTGPDGLYGTYDDGLPATYADFAALLTYIANQGDIPMIWCGDYLTYLIEFMNAVWADFEGYDQMKLNWTMDGVATDIVDTVSNDGTITYMNGGSVEISGNTGYLLQKQEGKYHALELAKTMVSNSNYYYEGSFTNSLTHLEAQKRFVKGGTGNYDNIAMLIDGNWWNVEASSYFDSDPHGTNGNLTRNFGFMPIPKANTSLVGTDRTLISLNSSMMLVNANTSESMMPVVEAFIKYAHSNEGLNTFTKYTNMMRPFDYELTEDTLNNISTYGKEMYRIHKEVKATADADAKGESYTYPIRIQDCYPTTKSAIKNADLLNPKTWGWTTKDYTNPFVAFAKNSSLTVKTYFDSLYDYYVGSWSAMWHN